MHRAQAVSETLTNLTSLRKEMDRLFERFGEPGWMEMPSLGDWEPKIDVSETKDAMVVTAEIPGVEQKDIAVSLQDSVSPSKARKKKRKRRKTSAGGTDIWELRTGDPSAVGRRRKQGVGGVQRRRPDGELPK